MSAAVTNRANHRPSKEKHAKTVVNQTSQPKAEGPPPQAKATPEQMRIAMITSGDHKEDAEFQLKVEQVMEITGKSKEICAIALQDCKNDTDRAVNMILEGDLNDGVGEWKETGKKKKRQQQPSQAPSKSEPISNHVDEKPPKTEQTADFEKPDRKDNKDNRSKGRRFDSRPPRLARGRGREKPEFFRADKVNGENENSDSNFGTFREGGFDDSRGRGRGRGGRSRGRGRGRGGGPGSGRGGRSFERGQKFDIGPQIDTWTNETAENAEKENSIGAWGDSIEDWNEDQWAGNLNETKIFTASTVQNSSVVENTSLTDSTSSLGQRLDLGALLNKPNDTDSFISQYNQQATESIKNSIGIGSNSRQSYSNQESRPAYQEQTRSSYNTQDQSAYGSQGYNNQDSRTYNSQDSRQSFTSQDSHSVYSSQDSRQSFRNQDSRSPFTSQESRQSYNDSSRQTYTSSALTNHLASQIQVPSSLSSMTESSAASAAVDALVSSLTQSQNLTTTALEQIGSSAGGLPVSQSSTPDPTPQVLQQRPKPQRSKLPPPSKIPASAVEMPGHQRTNVDVQFGNWECSTDNSPFSFGGSDTSAVENMTTLPNVSSSSMSNHLSQSGKQSESVMTSSRMTTPPNSGTSSISTQDSPRQSMFQNSPYTTPTKKDNSSLTQQNMSPPEPIPFPPDRKSSPLVSSQRPNSSSSLSQGSVSTSKQEGSLNYNQTAPGSYQSNFHQPPSSVLSSSAGLSNSMGLSRDVQGLSRDSSGLQNSSLARDSSSLSGAGLSRDGSGLGSTGLSRDSVGISSGQGLAPSSVLTSTTSLTNSAGLSHDSGSMSSNTASGGISNSSGLSNSGNLGGSSGLKAPAGFSSSTQPSSYQSQYQSGSNQFQPSQNQFNQAGQNQYQSGSGQYGAQNQYQGYGQSGGQFQNQNSYSSGGNYGNSSQSNPSSLYQPTVSNSYQNTQNTLYHQGSSSQASSYQQVPQSGYHHNKRESQAPGSYAASSGQSATGPYQRDGQTGLSAPATQTQMSYSSQNYQNNLASNLQTSSLNSNQLSETLSKMSVKENSLDTRQSPQYDSSPATTSSTLPTTTGSSTLSSGQSTPSAVTSTVITTSTGSSTRVSNANFTSPTSSHTSKAPPIPPGVQLLGHQYIMGQAGTLPYYPGLQQPLYGYEELQMLQRLPPLAGYNYDLSNFGVPTSVQSRDQSSLGNVPYTGADNKMQRVDAQSPIPSSQTQQSNPSTSQQQQQQQQHFNILPYGYIYSSVLPNAAAAAGFQFPQAMFPVPPVTNAAHAGTSANPQFQKTYGSHTYTGNKGYEDITPQSNDFSKPAFVNQSQNKMSAVSAGSITGMAGTTDLSGSAYGKSHTQMVNASDRLNKTYARGPRTNHDAFEKQGFPAGTPPPPFNLSLATGNQAGHLGAPGAPYGTPFVPLMPHSQMMHPGIQQDSSTGSSRGSHLLGQQSSSQTKVTQGKGYGTGYWGTN